MQNAKGKNKLQRQETLQSNCDWKDHSPKEFQTSHSYEKIKKAQEGTWP